MNADQWPVDACRRFYLGAFTNCVAHVLEGTDDGYDYTTAALMWAAKLEELA